jgi:hypothetical protein
MLVANMLVTNIGRGKCQAHRPPGRAHLQRQILNLDVRIITVVFIAGAAFAAVCGYSLLGPGRFLDGLWSIKAGSEHQFRTMGWSAPCFLLARAIALVAAGIGLSRHRGWARWATIALLMANLAADIWETTFRAAAAVVLRHRDLDAMPIGADGGGRQRPAPVHPRSIPGRSPERHPQG